MSIERETRNHIFFVHNFTSFLQIKTELNFALNEM